MRILRGSTRYLVAGAFGSALLLMAGNVRADTTAGLAEFRLGRFAEAFQQLQEAADAGDARGSLYLGVLFDTGLGVPKDETQAAAWYRRAADGGSAAAAFNLGVMYDAGLGVALDRRAAAAWYSRAAAGGFGRAAYNLAMLYETGTGVPRNRQRAIELYRKASEQGIAAASGHLAALGQQPAPVRHPTPDPALQDFQRAQELLLSRGMSDAERAAELFRKAAERNNALAQYDLAYCYERGIGVAADRAQASVWYHRAASQATDPALRAMAMAGVNSVANRFVAAEPSNRPPPP